MSKEAWYFPDASLKTGRHERRWQRTRSIYKDFINEFMCSMLSLYQHKNSKLNLTTNWTFKAETTELIVGLLCLHLQQGWTEQQGAFFGGFVEWLRARWRV